MQIEPLNITRLRELAAIDADPIVSLYLPTVGDDGDGQQPPIQLKNLLREAEQKLTSHGNPRDATQKWLRPVAELADDPAVWQRRNEAAAVFRYRSQLQVIRLMRPVEPCVAVGPHAHLTPMLTPQVRAERFALLALSLKRVRLLACSPVTVQALEGDDLPTDYESALGKYVDTERQLQYHGGASHAGGAQSPIYHGHGTAGDAAADQARRVEFCRVVDRAVRQLLRDTDLTLVLAADVPMAAIYRRVNRYHPLLDDTVAGNFDHLDDTALRDKALPLIERHVAEQQVEAVQRYRETPPDGTLRDTADVVVAAMDGRVDTLLVRAGAALPGRVRGRQVETNPRPSETHNGIEDLVNVAACLTLSTRGGVLALDSARMPCTSAMCAVLRY